MNQQLNSNSAAEEKIALFRSLFRGRTEVFPQRFESRKTGRAGYSPACGNEWVRGVCEKPKVKCSDCTQQAFLPVTAEIIRWHLSGLDDRGRPFVMGIYPMLLDETCHFLAVDFDKETWQEDVSAFLDSCSELGIPVALERSRSGNGGHVWFFFSEALPASLSRNLGSALLTMTMERRPDIGLKSYDRLFPNQDTLPKGGFGNLIALPLQKGARRHGNSVFIDQHFESYEDQWAFLSSIQRITRDLVEEVVRKASRHGGVVGVRLSLSDREEDEQPWMMPPSRKRKEPPLSGTMPKTLDLVLGDQIYIEKEALPPSLRNRLGRLAAFQNPEFYKAQAMRLPTYDKPRVIACAEETSRHIGVPRGCLDEVMDLLKSVKIRVSMRDERFAGDPLKVEFQGQLRDEQKKAVDALLAHEVGVLSAPPAFGKTVLASRLIGERGVNTLVLVHRKQLLDQWVDRLSQFLGLLKKEIGTIGGGRRNPKGRVDVALIQSMVRKGVVNDLVANYGHLIVDECHHLSAHSFELVARRAKARYVLGLSATVTRKDGHHPIIFMQCGPMRYRADAKRQAESRPFQHHVIVRPTGFRSAPLVESDARKEFHSLYDQLITDESRNAMICRDVLDAIYNGRSPLVLTERTEHLEMLTDRLWPHVRHVIVLRGGMGKKQSEAAREQLMSVPENEPRVLLATGRYLGEGFDDPRLDTLFLTLPVSWRGTIAQYAGRLHRLYEGKREVRIYDYADLDVSMLSRMFDKRCVGYEAVGYTILLPASALPGWPPEVPLPIDPQWKKDYAASVRRLIRDGVDVTLGNLFVNVTRTPGPGTEGIERARSASEAFLFRRLETLPETKGCFQLNAEIPIPFDERSKMEVDFLCSDMKLVVELDGDQHLADPEAYRRDRRKDVLLQENGYFVLRCLTSDLGKQLDHVLDAIMRAMKHCKRRVT